MAALTGPHVLSRQPFDLVGEPPVRSDRIQGRQTVLTPDLAVDLTEGGSQVHDPCPFLRRHIVRRHHAPSVGSGWRVPGR